MLSFITFAFITRIPTYPTLAYTGREAAATRLWLALFLQFLSKLTLWLKVTLWTYSNLVRYPSSPSRRIFAGGLSRRFLAEYFADVIRLYSRYRSCGLDYCEALRTLQHRQMRKI